MRDWRHIRDRADGQPRRLHDHEGNDGDERNEVKTVEVGQPAEPIRPIKDDLLDAEGLHDEAERLGHARPTHRVVVGMRRHVHNGDPKPPPNLL